MTFVGRLWPRLPLVVRAILLGVAAAAAGTLPWAVLMSAKTRHQSTLPWAVPLMRSTCGCIGVTSCGAGDGRSRLPMRGG